MRYSLFIFILLLPVLGFSQFETYLQADPEPKVERQWGGAFSVIESGSGFGLFYATPLKNFYHVGATLNLFLLRDSKQFEYYYYTFNKKNNVYLIDLMLTLKKRLMAYQIDDQFRPFVGISLGPVYGMNFPELKTDPITGEQYKNQFRWTMAGSAAAGVDIALDGNYMIGLRLQYRIMKFSAMLGERKDHSMFDVRIEFGKLF